MRKLLFSALLVFGMITGLQAQAFKIIGTNTIMGAATGTTLGAATMLISGTDDWGAVRVGFGGGTLVGLGLGIYDVSYSSGYIDGYLTSASTTGQVIAMDTFYGAATGSIVGFAISLIGNQDILEGIKVGGGYGAWAGFAFGLAETFFINVAGGGSDSGYGSGSYMSSNSVNGFMQYHSNGLNIGLIAPSTVNYVQGGQINWTPSVTFTHAKISF
ncbi:hypothetical protein EP331_10295 [bacterium]|nr:MAG: hypothetical protein EP331_10295 [bacterium]